MAYVLGFFAADGCMVENKRGAHFIEFHITDRMLLLKIRKLFNSCHKIAKRNRNKKWKIAYRLQIGSKEIFNDLVKLGFSERKSKSLKMPVIPDKYVSHFVRGYFDGDGNVYICKRKDRKNLLSLQAGFTCGSEIFLKELLLKLKKLAKIKNGTLYFRNNSYYCLYFSINDSIGLYDFLYNDCGKLFLPRKRNVFKKFIKARKI